MHCLNLMHDYPIGGKSKGIHLWKFSKINPVFLGVPFYGYDFQKLNHSMLFSIFLTLKKILKKK